MEASAHRANAREALRGNWVNAVVVALLVMLISDTGPKININLESSEPVQIAPPEQMQQFLHGVLGIAMPLILTLSVAFLIVGLILNGVMQVGSARFNLNLIDRKTAEIGDLFTAFPRFTVALVMHLLATLLTLLGFLLFIVPGFILQYGYAMAPYILAEDPDCSGWEALQRSWAMMKGHKLELLWLELTFFGWSILAAFTFGIGILFLNPYTAAAKASFYRDLSRSPVI